MVSILNLLIAGIILVRSLLGPRRCGVRTGYTRIGEAAGDGTFAVDINIQINLSSGGNLDGRPYTGVVAISHKAA